PRLILLPRLLKHVLNRNRLAPLPLALVGRFHECVNLNRLAHGNRSLARLEEHRDLLDERLVSFKPSRGTDALTAEHHRAVVLLTLSDAAEDPHAPVLPPPH